MLVLAWALVWQAHASWRHHLEPHADDSLAAHACVQCLAFAGLDHALPAEVVLQRMPAAPPAPAQAVRPPGGVPPMRFLPVFPGWRHASGLAAVLAPLALAYAQPTPAASPVVRDNAFNPAVSLVLSGTYAYLQRDPANWRLNGFQPGGEIGPPGRSFSLGESELGLSANVDPHFFGSLVLALSGEDEIAAEEAFVQSTSLPHGATLKLGRFRSALGYFNDSHAHAWDFVDAPLAYQAFMGGQFAHDGVQLKWLVPTETFLQLALEAGSGDSFPSTRTSRNGAGALALAAHAGGDLGPAHSWRAGASYLWTRAVERAWDEVDLAGDPVSNTFTGTSRTWVLDGVWKWAPLSRAARGGVTLQGEYFRRRERGDVTAALGTPAEGVDAYAATQSGAYVQAVWRFEPGWRTGLRLDRLGPGEVDYGSNGAVLARPGQAPRRTSWMVERSLSEFSRVRLQLADDRARGGVRDRQVFLQYQMSLGAHPAHGY